MFYCESCRAARCWPSSLGTSYGRCEVCQDQANCYDVLSRMLPEPNSTTTLTVTLGITELRILDAWLASWDDNDNRLPAGISYGMVLQLAEKLGLAPPRKMKALLDLVDNKKLRGEDLLREWRKLNDME